MFYATKIIRTLNIKNAHNDTHNFYKEIRKHFVNKMFPQFGLFIEIPEKENELKVLSEEKINLDFYVKIEFNAIFYKLFEEEIIEGTVYYMNSKGIFIENELLKNIVCIPEEGMFFQESGFDKDPLPEDIKLTADNSKFLNEITGSWYWIYDSYKLMIRISDTVRCKVIKMEDYPSRVLVSMNLPGFGPKIWWT